MNKQSYISQFNYQLYGPENGKKWVFLHGLMGSGANWRKIVSGLEATERILTYDQRGHGKSMKPQTGFSPADYAEDLFLILDELQWESIILVGHSMGGRNAMHFAEQYPERVQSLILEDVGPDGVTSAPVYYENLLASVPTPFVNKKTAKEFFLNEFIKLPIKADKINTLGQYLYSNIIELENGSADWRFSKKAVLESVYQGRGKSYWTEFENLKIPTLVIRGADSKELEHEVLQKMLKVNSKVQAVEISNAGHWVHSDQPLQFLNAVKKFVGV